MTKVLNHAYYAFCLLVAVLSELDIGSLNFLPENWRHKIAVLAMFAAWYKSHRNFFVNPNGTPAQSAWEPEKK